MCQSICVASIGNILIRISSERKWMIHVLFRSKLVERVLRKYTCVEHSANCFVFLFHKKKNDLRTSFGMSQFIRTYLVVCVLKVKLIEAGFLYVSRSARVRMNLKAFGKFVEWDLSYVREKSFHVFSYRWDFIT